MSFKRSSRLVRSRVQRAVLTRFILHWAALAATFFGTVFSLHYFLGNPVDPVSSILHQMWQRYSLLVVVSCALLPYFM